MCSSFFRRQGKPGYGIILVRKKSDGTVWVASRLLQSPAGRAGVKLFSQVLRIDDVPMNFSTDEEFGRWGAHSIPKEGDEVVYYFADSTSVRMSPEPIMKRIPVYWSPNVEIMPFLFHPDMNPRLEWCDKTGQYIPKVQISVEALKNVYFGN